MTKAAHRARPGPRSAPARTCGRRERTARARRRASGPAPAVPLPTAPRAQATCPRTQDVSAPAGSLHEPAPPPREHSARIEETPDSPGPGESAEHAVTDADGGSPTQT